MGFIDKPGKLLALGIVLGVVASLLARAELVGVAMIAGLIGGLSILISAIMVLTRKNGQF